MIDKRTDFPVATSVQKMNGTDFAGMSQKESWTGTTGSASEIYLTEVQWNKNICYILNKPQDAGVSTWKWSLIRDVSESAISGSVWLKKTDIASLNSRVLLK